MHRFTFLTLRLACSLLASLFLHAGASAQTAPTWQSAHAVGSIPRFTETAVDAAGNLYEIGDFEGTVTLAGTTLTSQGDRDGYLAKYTAAGTLAWVRQLGSAGDDTAQDVAVDAAGNVYITGNFDGSITLGNNLLLNAGINALRSKAFIIRYSPQGTPEWVQQSDSGSAELADGKSIGTDVNGNVYVTGHLNRSITFESTTVTLTRTTPGSDKGAYLARFSASTGALQSLLPAFSYSFTTGILSMTAPKLAVASTGEVFLLNRFDHSIVFSNTTLTTRGNDDVVVAKYSAQGTFEWAHQLGGLALDYLGNGVVDAAGNLYVTGTVEGPATFGTTTVPGYGSLDGYLVKYSALGTLEWVQRSGGAGYDRLYDVRVDAGGNPYVVGGFSGSAQFNSLTLTSAGEVDIAVASYTPQGQLRWAQSAGGLREDEGYSLSLDALDNIYVLGVFSTPCTFGPLALTTAAGEEKFVARLGSAPLTTRGRQALPVGLYPNPATTAVRIHSVPIGSQVQLLDAVGRITRTLQVAPDATIPLQGIKPGLYVVRATNAQGRPVTGRLVVE